MTLPTLFSTARLDGAAEAYTTAISFARASSGVWNCLATVIPYDLHHTVLRGLDVACAFGVLASLQIPGSLKAAYNAAKSGEPLGARTIKVIAHLGDATSSLGVTLQSLATIFEAVKPVFAFTTPLIFASVGLSSLHLVRHVRDLYTHDSNSVEYKVAKLKALAVVIRIIAAVILLSPAGPAGFVVGFALGALAAVINARASQIKRQADLETSQARVARLIDRCPIIRLEALST